MFSKEKFTNLGTANGWHETPKIIKLCIEKKHSPKQTGIGRCLTEVTCKLCKYKYLIDSSD